MREGGHRGGDVRYERVFRNVRNSLLQEKRCYCSTLIDFYGLPARFPGKSIAKAQNNLIDKAAKFCTALENALKRDIGENSMRRFIPYVQMYEFEALLFSDPDRFANGISRPDLRSKLSRIRNCFSTPEHINDSENTAPSKRIIKMYPGYEYQKPLYGVLAALEIGLPKIRDECPLFSAWLTKLEALPALSA
ncbi:MAG: DUF4276 family protein [Chloroflexi bacterium]|nr:DUF4276 family protein [Chloroflexota bacterium]